MSTSDPLAMQRELAAYQLVVTEARAGSLPAPTLSDPLALQAWRLQERRIADEVARRVSMAIDPAVRITQKAVIGGVAARIYTPPHWNGGYQVVLHGGGFVAGAADELVNDSLLTHRAHRTRLAIVSLEYSLSPEHPYPVARDETISVVSALRDEAPAGFIGIGGTSAGAAIAASAVLHMARTSETSLVDHVLLEVPPLTRDLSGTAAEHAAFEAVARAYVPSFSFGAFVADTAGPLGFPPATIVAAEFDALREGAEQFAVRLRREGSPVDLHVVPGTNHGSPGATAISAAAREWQDLTVSALLTASQKGRHHAH